MALLRVSSDPHVVVVASFQHDHFGVIFTSWGSRVCRLRPWWVSLHHVPGVGLPVGGCPAFPVRQAMPPEVIDLLLFLHTAARLCIAMAHGLTKPVHMLCGVRQGNPQSSLLYALLLEFLLRAQVHSLRPPGEAKRGLIQTYIDDLLVVANRLQHFVKGVESRDAYLGMMDMELNPRKCAMTTTEGFLGLQLRLCPHLEDAWHCVLAVDSVPYLGLQLQPDGGFSLQRKHRRRLAAVHHWCLNTLAPPKVVQDVVLAVLGGLTQSLAPLHR